MAGYNRPKCGICGKWYQFDYEQELFYPTCECKKKEEK